MRKVFFSLLLVMLIFLSGCVIDRNKVNEILSTPTINFPVQQYSCKAGQCVAMVCNGTSYTGYDYSSFYGPPLAKGMCKFVPVDEKTYPSYGTGNNPGHFYLRPLGVGIGGSFIEGVFANGYCNNSLTYFVRYLPGNITTGYVIPNPSRAMCLLEKGIIPVYTLHAGRPLGVMEVGEALKGAGPVMVVTEISYNRTNPIDIGLVKSQAISLKENCPNCLVGIYAMPGDALLKELSKDNTFNSSVDFVAYSLDSRMIDDCSPELLLLTAVNYSSYLLYNLSKPSFILSVQVDKTPKDRCMWLEGDENKLYYLLFTSTPLLQERGILGFAAYSLYSNPLNCTNCSFFSPHLRQGPFSMFFSYCRDYYNYYNFPPIVFGTTPATRCAFAVPTSQLLFFGNFSESMDTPLYMISLNDKEKPYFMCLSCFAFNLSSSPFRAFPPSDPHCDDEIGKVIDYWADVFDVDPIFLRAIASQESDFDECAVSFVPQSLKTCNTYNLDVEELFTYSSSSCSPPSPPCKIRNSWTSDPSEACGECRGGRERCKPCAYGMFQLTDYPGKFYEERRIPLPERIILCGGYDYDPFDINDSACAASYYIMKLSQKAREDIDNLPSSVKKALGVDEKNREWWVALFTAYAYHGDNIKSLLNDFQRQKEVDCKSNFVEGCCYYDEDDGEWKPKHNACCNNRDFVSYLEDCKGKDYGIKVMEKYVGIWKECGYCDESLFYENYKKAKGS